VSQLLPGGSLCVNLKRSCFKVFFLGADDFLARPLDESELGARIQALVRRSKGLCNSKIMVGSIVLDMDSSSVTVGGTTAHLTEKEYRILELPFLRGREHRGEGVLPQSLAEMTNPMSLSATSARAGAGWG
jgi:DNA-binding response OmpR family regulator